MDFGTENVEFLIYLHFSFLHGLSSCCMRMNNKKHTVNFSFVPANYFICPFLAGLAEN